MKSQDHTQWVITRWIPPLPIWVDPKRPIPNVRNIQMHKMRIFSMSSNPSHKNEVNHVPSNISISRFSRLTNVTSKASTITSTALTTTRLSIGGDRVALTLPTYANSVIRRSVTRRIHATSLTTEWNVYITSKSTRLSSVPTKETSVTTSNSAHSLTPTMTLRRGSFMRCLATPTFSCTTSRLSGAPSSRHTTRRSVSMPTTGMISAVNPTCSITTRESYARTGKLVLSSASTTRDAPYKHTVQGATAGKNKFIIHWTTRWTSARNASAPKGCSAGITILEKVTNAISTLCQIPTIRRPSMQSSLQILLTKNSTVRSWHAFWRTPTTWSSTWSTSSCKTTRNRSWPMCSTSACSLLNWSMLSLTEVSYQMRRWFNSALSSINVLDCTIHRRSFQIIAIIQSFKAPPHSKQPPINPTWTSSTHSQIPYTIIREESE